MLLRPYAVILQVRIAVFSGAVQKNSGKRGSAPLEKLARTPMRLLEGRGSAKQSSTTELRTGSSNGVYKFQLVVEHSSENSPETKHSILFAKITIYLFMTRAKIIGRVSVTIRW